MSFISRRTYQNFLSFNYKDTRTVVFIDSSLPNCETIVQKVIPTARVIIIGSEDDGVKEISRILNTSNCFEVHIFSTGIPGCIYLGNSELSLNTLITYSSEVESWFDPNKNDNLKSPHLWMCGCNLAAGDVGDEFIAKLNKMTDAKISASVNILKSKILSD